MEQNQGLNGRFVLALGLSIVILIVWQMFFLPPPQEPDATDGDAITSVQRSENDSAKAGESNDNQPKTPTAVAQKDVPVVETALNTDHLDLILTSRGGGLMQSATVKDPSRYGVRGNFVGASKEYDRHPLAITLPTLGVGPDAHYAVTQNTPTSVDYALNDTAGGFIVERHIESTDTPFVFKATVTLKNLATRPIKDKLYVSTITAKSEDQETGFLAVNFEINAKCYHEDGLDDIGLDKDGDSETYEQEIQWVATDEPYFATILIANEDTRATQCKLKSEEFNATASLVFPVDVAANGEQHFSFRIYSGPKEERFLSEAGDELSHVINYGWLEIIAKPMAWVLTTFSIWFGNWGLAIILMTIIIRLMMWPIAQRSQESMMQMSKIGPELNALKEKYKDDPAMLQQKQMELYKERNINPFGCLPLFLQMPIFFALYRTINVMGGLYNAPFFGWIQDLSAPDPYFILPVLVIVLFFLQQLISPSGEKTTQQKIMMYMMPFIFGIMMLFLPAALNVYMVFSTLFSILQSYLVRRKMQDEDNKKGDSERKNYARNRRSQKGRA